MNEQEWKACVDPRGMLEFLLGKASGRKLRLFAVACCRRIQHIFPEEKSAEYRLNTAERYADGLATAQELRSAHTFFMCGGGAAFAEFGNDATNADPAVAAIWAHMRCEAAARFGLTKSRPFRSERPSFLGLIRRFFGRPLPLAPPSPPVESGDARLEYHSEVRGQWDLLRDIFGNPFRPVTFDPAWRTTDVMLLARGIYEEKAFDRMPILADALQDAGCDSDALLAHLRDTTAPHVRGCWALDLVLGKD